MRKKYGHPRCHHLSDQSNTFGCSPNRHPEIFAECVNVCGQTGSDVWVKVGVTRMESDCAVKYFEHWEQVRSLAVRENREDCELSQQSKRRIQKP